MKFWLPPLFKWKRGETSEQREEIDPEQTLQLKDQTVKVSDLAMRVKMRY